jgi:glucose/arabinose dehydrogenase
MLLLLIIFTNVRLKCYSTPKDPRDGRLNGSLSRRWSLCLAVHCCGHCGFADITGLICEMRTAKWLRSAAGWQQGETPTVAPRLKIEPLARDLQHPRSIYVLPNGDILVGESKSPNAQPIQRPKDGGVESWVTLGGKAGESNRRN